MNVNSVVPKSKSFYDLKEKIVEHVLGVSSSGEAHIMALMGNAHKSEEAKKSGLAMESKIRSRLSIVKMKAAGLRFEQQIGMLAAESVNVGTIGHSRYNFELLLFSKL